MQRLNRPRETACVSAHLTDGECCAVVGLNNTGKSTLLRSVCATETQQASRGKQAFLLYVDCNRMLELSEQGFYEAILRATRSRLRELASGSELVERLDQAYKQVVEPPNPLAVPLGFNDAMEGLCEAGPRVVLVLDEFDEPFEALEGRTFLNLRALRDRYRERLTYVTATARTLERVRDDPETAEFRELFAGRVCRLRMLEESEARSLVAALAQEEGTSLTEEETGYVIRAGGGHLGLLHGIIRLLVRARTEAPQTYGRMGLSLVADALAGSEIVRVECERLWTELTPAERRGLIRLASGEKVLPDEQEQLGRLGLVTEDGALGSEAFAVFVLQRGKRMPGLPQGVWVDEDAGEVYVDGRRTPTLTDLEYRLVRALYERKDKLCDKYRLVETVWGESYIDEVDDARIEKLVSRVRSKIEEDPANPRYLVTTRGRGYRLLSHPETSET